MPAACKKCGKQASDFCKSPLGYLCRKCCVPNCGVHKEKIGLFRGTHSKEYNVLKLNFRKYKHALEHAWSHLKRARGLTELGAKKMALMQLVCWFAQIQDLYAVLGDIQVTSGPCVGLSSAQYQKCYHKFSALRKQMAEQRTTLNTEAWAKWEKNRLAWEKDDDDMFGKKTDAPVASSVTEIPPQTLPVIAYEISLESDSDISLSPVHVDKQDLVATYSGTEQRRHVDGWEASETSANRKPDEDSSEGLTRAVDAVRASFPHRQSHPWVISADTLREPKGEAEPDREIWAYAIEIIPPYSKKIGPFDGGLSPRMPWLDIDLAEDVEFGSLDRSQFPVCRHWIPSQSGGRFPWDFHSKPQKIAAHRSREQGEFPTRMIKGSQPWSMQKLIDEDHFVVGWWTHTRRLGQLDLIGWALQRGRNFISKFDKMIVVDMKKVCPRFPSTGTFLYMQIHGTTNPFENSPPEDQRWGAHATSPYCLRRIIETGSLDVGFSKLQEKEKEIEGCFYHELADIHLCQGSYSHYVPFTGQNYFFAPYVIIRSDLFLHHHNGQPKSTIVRVNQRLSMPGYHDIIGVLWHMVHTGDMLQQPAKVEFMCEAAWSPVWELSPDDAWAKIMHMSKEAAAVPSPNKIESAKRKR